MSETLAVVTRTQLLYRIKARYMEMPGLRLTSAQAGRLWGPTSQRAGTCWSVSSPSAFCSNAPTEPSLRTSDRRPIPRRIASFRMVKAGWTAGVTAMVDEGRRVLIDLPFEAAVGATTAAIHREGSDDPRARRRAGAVQDGSFNTSSGSTSCWRRGPRGGVRGDSTASSRCGRAGAGAVCRLRACRRRDRGDRRRTQRARPARARPPSPPAAQRCRDAGGLKAPPSTGGRRRRP